MDITPLLDFMRTNNRNEWLDMPPLRIYVRKSKRYVFGEWLFCLDLATIGVEESEQGKGIFSHFLSLVEALCPYDGILIENILDNRFVEFFEKRGYINITPGLLSPTYLRRNK